MSPDHRALGIPGLENPEVIGQGGYGTVFAADEPEFGRKVAVKVLLERLDGASVRRAFVRECQAMGALSGHPHIVTVHRGGTTERGEPYIVMDFMSAGSLSDRLGRDGPLAWAEVVEIGVLVAGALETAHRAGILHLDLKPANLLVSRYGEPKLGDFGISRLAGAGAGTESTGGRVRASAAYAAPERLLEGTATVASDVYGLGATLFALLTGRPAFVTDSGEDLLATIARVVRDPVPNLRARGVPDPVARVVERLMEKSPAARFPTSADAAAALQAAQRSTGRPVTRAVIEGAAPGPAEPPILLAPPTRQTVLPTPPPVRPPARPPVRGLAVASGPVGSGPVPPPAGPTLVGAPVAPALGPPPPAAPRRQRGLLIAAVAVAVIVIVGAAALGLMINRPTGTGGTNAPQPTSSAPRTSEGKSPSTSTPPTPTAVVIPPDDVITVADGVTHPDTVDARTVLRGYVTAINASRYADAFALFSTDSETYKGGLDTWQRGQSTTIIDGPRIASVSDNGPNALEVVMTFTSFQAAEFGPDGQTCTRWELAYDLVGPGPNWLIRKARALNPPAAC